jgi:predicted nuclease with TOPRIM domain
MSFEIIMKASIGACVFISIAMIMAKLHELHRAVAYLYRFLNDPEGYMHKIQSLVTENYELTTKNYELTTKNYELITNLEKLKKTILKLKSGEQK